MLTKHLFQVNLSSMDQMANQQTTSTNELLEKASLFPDKPGVYLMKNEKKKIIYVGKAKSLKNRIRSYFSSMDPKTRLLMEAARDLDFIITRNEYEALVLENNLIKQWSPFYNIKLKDGKTYPMIRITNEQFPRVFKTRRIILDGSEYYGPFPDGSRIDLYMNIIRKMFPLRRCKGPLKKRSHPCLYYHIKQCSGACCGLITKEKYGEIISGVRKLLSGKSSEIKADLEASMKEAAETLRYEEAAIFRDRLSVFEHVGEIQHTIDLNEDALDYIGFYTTGTLCTYVVLKVRSGNIAGKEVYQTRHYTTDEDALVQFILQYYGKLNLSPKSIFIPINTDTDQIESFFREKLGKRVHIRVPERGKHRHIVDKAIENAREDIELRKQGLSSTGALEELRIVLGLETVPATIEGFDISHLSGKFTVASMVAFEHGRPDKGSYRYFKIKSLGEGRVDDFESIREAVARRYTRVINEGERKPDLVLIDGGLGQVNAATHILKALGLTEIACIGLAKKNEEIYFPGKDKPLVLERTSSALHILQAVRDESHRFATGLSKRLRKKSISRLVLEKIEGIGPKKSVMLLKKFGSVKGIMDASIEEIEKEGKIGRDTANNLVSYLKNEYWK
jgi:excinuclease ABC subunit C